MTCEQNQKDDTTFLWRLSDQELTDELSRYSHITRHMNSVEIRLAYLAEGVRRVLTNQIKKEGGVQV